MKTSIFTILTFAMLLAGPVATNTVYAETADSFGFSSDDFGGASYLGVDTRDVTADRLGPLHLKEERGVEITMVDQDAPAGKAGLKEQDVIMTLNGSEVQSVEQLRRMIRETPPGRVVSLGISRNGQPMTIKIQLGERHNNFSYNFTPKMKDFNFNMPSIPPMPEIDIPVSVVVVHSAMRSGLMVENLTPQLGDFFGAKNGEGVLVRSVEKGSRADKAGFKAGDVIIKVNGEGVHDAGDFAHALRARKDNTASVSIVRDKKEQTLSLVLPDRSKSELDRESFDMDLHQIGEETRTELSQLKCEMARLKPELDEAVNRSLEAARPAFERQRQEMRKQSLEMKKQMEEMKKQMREQTSREREELKRELGKLDEI